MTVGSTLTNWFCVINVVCGLYTQGIFCDGTRKYGVPGNENDESILFMSVSY